VTAICFVPAFRSYIKTTSGRLWWDSLLLTVPMLRDAVRKAETARFARAMSTLVANSVPWCSRSEFLAAILNNRKMRSLEMVSQRGEAR
jgi:type II secretory pathway component PulF